MNLCQRRTADVDVNPVFDGANDANVHANNGDDDDAHQSTVITIKVVIRVMMVRTVTAKRTIMIG